MSLPADLSTFHAPIMGSSALSLYSGRVMDEKMWSESHVSGGGGGGMTFAGYGASSTRSVKTTVVNKREIWLKLDDGTEMAVEADANKVKVRKGQYVSMVTMKGKKKGEKAPILVYNHASNETAEAINPIWISMANWLGGTIAIITMFYTFFAIFALFLGGSIFWGLIVPLALYSYFFFGKKKAQAMYNRLDSHMRSLPRRVEVEAA